jgi:hypothetical protein
MTIRRPSVKVELLVVDALWLWLLLTRSNPLHPIQRTGAILMLKSWSRACSAFIGGLGMAGSCFAATIVVSIPTNSTDVQYTPTGYTSPVTVTGHGASGTQAVPGWTWNYTGSFADPRYQMYMSSSNTSYACLGPQTGISVPYDCDSDDNLTVPAGNDYPGYEFHYFAFVLPAGAQSPRINFQTLGSDDRAVVTLNGQLLGNFASPAADQPHLGPSGTELRTFALLPGPTWFDDPALFQTGTNVLRLWVNNTGGAGSGTAKTHAGGGGSSGSVVRGFLTYEYVAPLPPATAVPTLSEWARIVLAMLMTAAAGWYLRKGRA